MGKKLSKTARKILTIIAGIICALLVPYILILCFYYGLIFFLKYVIDINGRKHLKYIKEYMDAIPVTCTEYILAEPDDSKYSLFIEDKVIVTVEGKIVLDGIEKKIDIERDKNDKDYSLTIGEKTVNINEEFMAKKSAEYVTISEMWYRYDDDMDNYQDDMPNYMVRLFDNNVFIVTRFKRGGSDWWFNYKLSMPACLFRYDIENDTVLYSGYFIRDYMTGNYQIEKTEQA